MKILLILLLVVGLGAMVVKWQSGQYRQFMATAKTVSGKIAGKEVKNPRLDQPTRKENWVNFEYTVGGKTYEGKDRVEYDDLWSKLSEGQEAPVYFDPENPGHAYLALLMDRRLGVVK